MARAVLENITRRIGDATIVDRVSLDVADGELVAVLGPSGCGKSTLLRLVAGLDQLSSGTIVLGERRIDDVPAHERDVAMVFQSYALYPHLTVRGNVEFPLRMRGMPRAERARRVEHVATLVELDGLLDRKSAALSGGQRQRVALARALVREPALFLLDEPLSNLDARLRADVRRSIRALQQRLGVTTLYVTHDQTEAMTLGDRVVVIERGHVQQVGTPLEVYERPANAFVAGFVGAPPMNLLTATWDGARLRVGEESVALDDAQRAALGDRRGEVPIGVRPEALVPSATPSTVASASASGAIDDGASLVARVEPRSAEILGGETLLRARLGAATLVARLPGNVAEPPAQLVAAMRDLFLFDAKDGRRLFP
jgi:multiple sugar transport system ATP-binding protein